MRSGVVPAGRRACNASAGGGRAGYHPLRASTVRPRFLAPQRSSSTESGHDCRPDCRRTVRCVTRRFAASFLLNRIHHHAGILCGTTAERVPCVRRGALHHVQRGRLRAPAWPQLSRVGRSGGTAGREPLRGGFHRPARRPAIDHGHAGPSHVAAHVAPADPRPGVGTRGGGHVCGATVAVPPQRMCGPLARGQHDGRVAGQIHRPAAARRAGTRVRACARRSCGSALMRVTTSGGSASCETNNRTFRFSDPF